MKYNTKKRGCDITIFALNMQHKRVTKHSFFRLNQTRPAIQNRITGLVCLNARKLTMFCHTL
ncbi:hypothetical protein, partial [Companilactobacillus zhachilii]|uniref:hypothetical protein n=1 Tax=Companilactobacillus zhachilii TaxID=2304606 RepID=UPI001F1FAD6F